MKLAGTLAAIGVAAFALAQDPAGFAPVEPLVSAAIARHELPGAVVLVGHGDAIVYHSAFGHRALEPSPEPMTEDTVFDVASLTKVVATTTSVMQLVERGQIRLNDRVAQLIPEFSKADKNAITVRHLLTHTSGLAPDLPLEVEFNGTDEVPVVRAVGGLVDTVRNYNARTGEGTGFSFDDYSAQALLDTIRWALGTYSDRGTWERIQRAGMGQDFSWDASARQYVKVYERALGTGAPVV